MLADDLKNHVKITTTITTIINPIILNQNLGHAS